MQRFSAPIKDNQFHQHQHTKNLYTHDDFYLRFARTTAVAVCKCMQIERECETESILTATINRLGALKVV